LIRKKGIIGNVDEKKKKRKRLTEMGEPEKKKLEVTLIPWIK